MRRAASTWDVRPMNFRRALPSWAACNGCGDGSCSGRREGADGGTGDGNVNCNIARCDIRVSGGGGGKRWEAEIGRAFGGVVWKEGSGFTLHIRTVVAKVGEGTQGMKDCVKGIADGVGEGRLAMFAASEKVISKWIEGFATRACVRKAGGEWELQFSLEEDTPIGRWDGVGWEEVPYVYR